MVVGSIAGNVSGLCVVALSRNLKLTTTLDRAITKNPCYVPLNLNKMEILKVINLKSELKSFSWNDGLFAIQKEVDGILHLWKIKDGKLDRYNDGTPNICCTGVNNKGIHPTDLVVSA